MGNFTKNLIQYAEKTDLDNKALSQEALFVKSVMAYHEFLRKEGYGLVFLNPRKRIRIYRRKINSLSHSA